MLSYTRVMMRRGRGPVALAAALLLALGGCDLDELLTVDDVDVVSRPVFENPDNLASVHAGAVREFARAYGGEYNNEGGQVHASGLLADELFNSDNFSDRQAIDARNMQVVNGANQTAYSWLHRARNHAEVAVGLMEANAASNADEDYDWEDERAELLGLAGFTYVMFGENYCGGVPFSTIPQEGETVFGAAETTQEIFARAIARFDAALALDADPAFTALAQLGKARAMLNLATTPAEVSAAADAVSGVATDFVYRVGYSDAITTAANAVWQLINAEKRWSASDAEGANGLPFVTDADPRTPTSESPLGGLAGTIHFNQLKYPEQGTDIPLATGIEARLIEAEAALRTDDRPGFFAIHNALRDMVTGLADLTDTGQSFDELVDLHFRERAYWLWLTSHRLGDMRRLLRQYGRQADDVYPIGPTVRGEGRGNDVNLLVPFAEESNPEYDPGACNNEVP